MMNSLQKYKEEVNGRLACAVDTTAPSKLKDAMLYALLSGGKRVRPLLFLAAYEITKPADENAYSFAVGVECMHAYSLVHDDLPCMDNDEMRRGKPTVHKAFGEGAALLTGDALLNLSYQKILGACVDSNFVSGAQLFANACGAGELIGGQFDDTEGEKKDAASVRSVYRRKTGALIHAAATAGAVCSGASEDVVRAVSEFSQKFGLAFQLYDDLSEDDDIDTLLKYETRENVLREYNSLVMGAKNAVHAYKSSLNQIIDMLEVK